MAFLHLIGLCSLMLFSTLLAAFLPTYLHLSTKRLETISRFGTGLLVGAALGIVVPEGVEAVYRNSLVGGGAEHHHDGDDGDGAKLEMQEMAGHVGVALLGGFLLMYLIDSVHSHHQVSSSSTYSPGNVHRNRRGSDSNRFGRSSSSSELAVLKSNHRSSASADEYNAGNISSSDWDEEEGRIGGGTGASRSDDESSSLPPSPAPAPSSSKSASRLRSSTSSTSLLMPLRIPASSSSSESLAAVLGLLAHALADGISLGASSLSPASSAPLPTALSSSSGSSGAPSLELIIFLAIMVHKAPTALALSALLLSDPTSSPAFVRRSLLAFSLASPAGALLIYSLLNLLGAGSGSEGIAWYAGMAMCFSGGTFLFVATHVMKSRSGSASGGNGTGDLREGGVGIMVLGMVVPFLLAKLVGHGH